MNRYLGVDSLRTIAQVRAREPEWFALADDVGAYAGDLMHDLHVPRGDKRLLLAALLYRRVTGAFEALMVLAERGMYTEGLATRRAMLQALFVLGAICNQPTLVEDYIKNDEHRRRDIFKNIKKLNPKLRAALAPELTPEVVDQSVAELECSTKCVTHLGPGRYAQAAKLNDLYLTDYAFLSEAAHHVAKDLERNIALDADGDVDGFYWGPEPDRPSTLLFPATDHMLMAAHTVATMFNLDRAPLLEQLRQRVENMFKRLPMRRNMSGIAAVNFAWFRGNVGNHAALEKMGHQ